MCKWLWSMYTTSDASSSRSVWGKRPAHVRDFRVVDRALVVAVMELSRSDQRIDARRIDVVGDFLFHDPHVVALSVMQQRQTALDRLGVLQGDA